MLVSTDPSSLLTLRPCDHVQGDIGTTVTLITYGSYTSLVCSNLHQILSDLQHHFRNQLQVVFRHFPLPDVEERSLHAAEAAEAAGVQGKFWQMHDRLFSYSEALGDGELVECAIALGLNVPQFLQEMRQDVHVDRIRSDLESGIQLGIEQSPGLFLNGCRYRNILSFESLKSAIDRSK
jgi:protein-disulfide isomerase